MITQIILNLLAHMVAGLIALIPPMPPAVASSISEASAGMTLIATTITKAGILIPFDTITAIVGIWVTLLAFWGSLLTLRFLLWIFGR